MARLWKYGITLMLGFALGLATCSVPIEQAASQPSMILADGSTGGSGGGTTGGPGGGGGGIGGGS